MLIVQNGSQIEPLNHIKGLDVNQEVKGAYTASFTSFNYPNNPGYELLEEESIVFVEDQEFRVKQFEEVRNSKRIVAIHTFYDLADQRQDSTYGGTRTFNEFATFVLQGTGWTFSSTVAGSRFIENFGENNIIVLINALCAVYECEYEIRANKHVHFAPQIGGDNDAQYRYGHNVKALSKKVDTTNLKTYIEGYGANNLFVSYTSPFAGDPRIGIRKADPIRDDRFTQSDSLLEHIKRELNDEIQAYFELDSVELTNKELGERVWLIYEPLGIEFQTRILKQTKSIRNGKLVTTKVVLGNTLPKSTTDILISQKVEIDENKKEYRSKFTQTNELIHLSVEAINESIATIELRADSIVLSVTGLDTRMGQAESSISIQAGQISSKVSQTDYNGNTIASLINQSATTIDIQASKINLIGAVSVLSDISGNLGTITAGTINISTDVHVGNRIYLGNQSDSSIKSLYFNSRANIAGGNGFAGGDVQYNADTHTFIGDVSITGSHNITAKWG